MRRLLPALLLLACGPLAAAELAGVTLPDRVEVDGRELVLNGAGLREKLMFDVYVGGLYLESPTSDADAILASAGPVQIRMHFVYRKLAPAKLTDAWTEGFEANGASMQALGERLARLNGLMEPVVRGDTMVFTAIPGEGLRVEVKGRDRGVIEGDDFIRAFLAVFLGPEPPTAALKRGLLGE